MGGKGSKDCKDGEQETWVSNDTFKEFLMEHLGATEAQVEAVLEWSRTNTTSTYEEHLAQLGQAVPDEDKLRHLLSPAHLEKIAKEPRYDCATFVVNQFTSPLLLGGMALLASVRQKRLRIHDHGCATLSVFFEDPREYAAPDAKGATFAEYRVSSSFRAIKYAISAKVAAWAGVAIDRTRFFEVMAGHLARDHFLYKAGLSVE